MPLLRHIAGNGAADDRVCPIVAATPEKNRAGIYREHLQCADVDHAPFYVETATHLMIDFRSLRDSGITWRFLAEHRESVVQREAGHEHISTTLGYAKEVQDKKRRYGEPFPALPEDLTDSPPPAPVTIPVTEKTKPLKNRDEMVGEAGFAALLEKRRLLTRECGISRASRILSLRRDVTVGDEKWQGVGQRLGNGQYARIRRALSDTTRRRGEQRVA